MEDDEGGGRQTLCRLALRTHRGRSGPSANTESNMQSGRVVIDLGLRPRILKGESCRQDKQYALVAWTVKNGYATQR